MEKTELSFAQAKKFLFAAGMRSPSYEELNDVMNRYTEEYYVDPNKFTVKELFSFGAKRMNDEVILIPLWMLQFVSEGFEFVDIHGDTKVVGKDEFDLTLREGLVQYGVFKEVEEEGVSTKIDQAALDKFLK